MYDSNFVFCDKHKLLKNYYSLSRCARKKDKNRNKTKKKHTHTNNKEANKNNSKRECGKKPVKENMTDKTLSTYTYFELEIPRDK